MISASIEKVLMMDQVAEVERFDNVVVDASVKIHHDDQLEITDDARMIPIDRYWLRSIHPSPDEAQERQ
jgi:hypothetical protein